LPDLTTYFCGLKLASPLIVSSAGITRSAEMMARAQQVGAGAVIAKGFSDVPTMRRSPSPRYALLHREAGPLAADTFYSYEQASEHDAEAYAELLAEAKRQTDLPVLANVDCQTVESFVENTRVIAQSGCDALELNVSCPHGSIAFSGQQVEERIVEVAREVRGVVSQPLIIKLTPQLTNPTNLVAALAETGIQGVTLFNRFLGLQVDLEAGRPIMHGGFAGHGGLWMHNFVLRWVADVSAKTPLQISASGGTGSGQDAAALLLAGAATVQLCSIIYLEGWQAVRRIRAELEAIMDRLGAASLDDLRGKLHGQILGLEEVDRRKFFVAEIQTRGIAPCRAECPVHEDVQGYVNLVAEGKYEQALALIVANHPFAHTLGRCCHHPCETACARGEVDEPISIRELKRAAAEQGEAYGPVRVPRAPQREEKIAIIGAGPAGLTAAYRLGLLGYAVTVFDRLDRPGGMLVAGIPAYRLPRQALEADLQRVWDAGVELRSGVELGRDFTLDDLLEDHRAVIIACGAHKQRRLNIPGEDLDGVVEGIALLRAYNLGLDLPQLGRRVAIIGGGDVAVDAARVARRLGAEVLLLYRRRREDMPARDQDLAEALEEGVELVEQVQPIEIARKDDGSLQVLAAATAATAPGRDGRAGFEVLEDERALFDVDSVVVAIGQELDNSWLDRAGASDLLADGRLAADPVTGTTQRPGVFACGDAVTGPRPLVEAVAAGKRAALAVDAWLRGEDPNLPRDELPLPRVEPADAVQAAGGEDLLLTRRQRTVHRPVPERLAGDIEVNLGLRRHHVQPEAARCLACGGCGACGDCMRACPYLAIERRGKMEVDPDKCDGCGLCALLCAQGAIEMKPAPEA